MTEEIEYIDDGDDMMDEAVLRGIERATTEADAQGKAELPPPPDAPDGVGVTGKLRRVNPGVARDEPSSLFTRHYGPGPHPSGSPQEVHAGKGSKGKHTEVGITSARPGKEPGQVFEEMRSFESDLRDIKSVSNISVKPGVGGWEGGEEPTWVVQYDGNGEALRLIVQTAKKFEQDAVLMMSEPTGDNSNPVTDWKFDEHLDPNERDWIERTLVRSGIGGWTWYRSEDGRSVLRAAHIPEWSGPSNEFLRSADQISRVMAQTGLRYDRQDGSLAIQLFQKEGEHSYDSVLR